MNSGGVTSLCYDKTGFSCAGGGYNGTSSQIGGNGWTTAEYWAWGSPGPNGTRHNCTTYAAYRLQQNGYHYPGWTSNANGWAVSASKDGVTVNQTPAVGAIAQWNKGDGHVAYVEAVTSSYIETTSDSYDGGTDHLRISLNSAYMPDNFIHFKDAPQTLPAQPADLKVTSITGTSAVLTWTEASDNATSFVSQHRTGGGSWMAGPSAGAGARSMTVTGLTTGTTYTFQVGANNAKGTRWSAYRTVKTVPIPAEPTIGNPAMAARDATISWNEAAGNETEFLTQYKLGSGAWRAGPSVGSGTRSVTIGGLIPGESYTFQVGANNIAGTRWSAYATGSTPQVLASQVTNASVTATSETAAALAWTNTADNVASFVTQYRVTGTSAWTAGPSVGAGTRSVTVGGLKAGTKYTFQVGAENSKGTNWGQYFYGTTASAPAPAPAPAGYNTGREVTVVSQATGGDSGHKGPANSYAAGPTHAAGSPIYIVCYVNGQSIAGPYGTETVWDLGDDGYYYSDAWLWTDSNGPVVPACDLKTVTVVSQATGGDSGHTGPSNAYAAGPARAAGSDVQIACYVSGQSIAGPYGTESTWDLSTDGYYYSDAWLWTDSNGPVVPECP
jgi:surface antigen